VTAPITSEELEAWRAVVAAGGEVAPANVRRLIAAVEALLDMKRAWSTMRTVAWLGGHSVEALANMKKAWGGNVYDAAAYEAWVAAESRAFTLVE